MLTSVFAVHGLLSLGSAPAMAGHVGCGDTITTDTTLHGDLLNCPGDGIVIGADDITLDLNGHTVDGDERGFDVGIANTAGHDGVTIEGGLVRGFFEGVLIDKARDNVVRDLSTSHQAHAGIGVVRSVDTRVERISSFRNGPGIFVVLSTGVGVVRNSVFDNSEGGIPILESDRVRVARNSVSGSGRAGIPVIDSDRIRIARNSISTSFEGVFLEGDSSHNVVAGNSISRNGEGMVLDPVSNHNVIKGNSIRKNRWNGVVLVGSDDNLIARNSIVGNGTDPQGSGRGSNAGIHLFWPSDEPELTCDRNVISGNTLAANALDGILVEARHKKTVIEENRSNRNDDDGIDVNSASTTIGGNTENSNHDLGIEAVRGVVDRGGNEADGNGDKRQCTHVRCR